MIKLNKQYSLKKLDSGKFMIICSNHKHASCWHIKRVPKYVQTKAEFISNNNLLKDELTWTTLSSLFAKVYIPSQMAKITNLTGPGWIFEDQTK